jgi:hypothetical protein
MLENSRNYVPVSTTISLHKPDVNHAYNSVTLFSCIVLHSLFPSIVSLRFSAKQFRYMLFENLNHHHILAVEIPYNATTAKG